MIIRPEKSRTRVGNVSSIPSGSYTHQGVLFASNVKWFVSNDDIHNIKCCNCVDGLHAPNDNTNSSFNTFITYVLGSLLVLVLKVSLQTTLHKLISRTIEFLFVCILKYTIT